MRSDLPTGTVTFCFTDVEGSTRLLHELGAEAYAEALAEHRRVIREACAAEGGVEVDTQGDAFFFAFPTARGALAAASSFTDALAAGPIQVRCGLHTGTPLVTEEGYVGEDVHLAARIGACGHGGQVLVSPATAELLVPVTSALGRHSLLSLGSHRLKDLAEPISLYQLGEDSFPPLKTIANSNLPTPASSFLGREQELHEADLLLHQTRLLTVSGPGGQGKTRFSLELARRAREERFSDYPDGVFSSFLASLRDPGLVLPTLCQTLNVTEQPGQSALEALASYLQGKKLLLLLDNLEHLLACASELSALLERAEGLTLLVTSREVLRIHGERSYVLPPLEDEESLALLCERARTEPSSPLLELAHRLEGLPLALELAAARLTILTPAQLLERLSQRLDLLKAGRDADPRQQTLRATIAWSYDLLTAEEQRLFRSLSVFSGGCTLEAAEEVAGADLDTLHSLVDKSLLRFTDERFWMLETIREYAGERLEEAGEAHALRDRHADFFLALAEANEPPQMGGVDEAWVVRFTTEIDNLRSAIAYFAGPSDPTRELRLVGSLFRYWPTAGLLVEGRRLAEHALSREASAPLRMKVLYTAAICAGYAGDLDGVECFERERQALAEALGDHVSAAVALYDLGRAAAQRGDWDRASSYYERSAELAESIGDELIAVNVRTAIAWDRFARGADPLRVRDELIKLRDRASSLDAWTLGHTLEDLGLVHLALGEDLEAVECFTHMLEDPSYPVEIVFSALMGFAALAFRAGDSERAALLEGAVQANASRMGFAAANFSSGLDGVGVASRHALDDDAFESAVAEGQALTLEEAIDLALRLELPEAEGSLELEPKAP